MATKKFNPDNIGFGRIFQPDKRDKDFPASRLLPMKTPPKKICQMWYDNRWRGDQGNTNRCTAFSGLHYLEDDPQTDKGSIHPILDPDILYANAQALDGIPMPHEGSTVRAVAKYLQSIGLIGAYHWATTIDEVVNAILTYSPVVMGTNWYTDMFTPDPAKGYTIKIGGKIEGGHAYLLNGVNKYYQGCRLKNSWGTGWGSGGDAFISFKDVERLLLEDGECLIGVKLMKP